VPVERLDRLRRAEAGLLGELAAEGGLEIGSPGSTFPLIGTQIDPRAGGRRNRRRRNGGPS